MLENLFNSQSEEDLNNIASGTTPQLNYPSNKKTKTFYFPILSYLGTEIVLCKHEHKKKDLALKCLSKKLNTPDMQAFVQRTPKKLISKISFFVREVIISKCWTFNGQFNYFLDGKVEANLINRYLGYDRFPTQTTVNSSKQSIAGLIEAVTFDHNQPKRGRKRDFSLKTKLQGLTEFDIPQCFLSLVNK